MNKFLKYPNSLLIRGLIFFISAYYPFLISEERRTHFVIITSMTLFYLAIIDLSEYISFKFGKTTLKQEFYKGKDTKRKIILGGLIGGLLLDGSVQWLGKMWIYPYWSTWFYFIIFTIGFAFYFITILESYTAVKIVIDYMKKGKQKIPKRQTYEKKLFDTFAMLGAILITIGLYILISNYSQLGGYIFDMNSQTVLNENQSMIGLVILFLGMWLILEYLLYINKENSLIQTAIHGYYTPIWASYISAFILLALMESLNGPLLLWKYVNFPLEEIKVFSMPILGVIGWPFQNIALVNLYALIFNKDEDILICGDKIP